MSEEINKKLFEHYSTLIKGNVKTGNPIRDDLIVSDAKRHLADLIKKNPSLKPEEEIKPVPITKPLKSKGKK